MAVLTTDVYGDSDVGTVESTKKMTADSLINNILIFVVCHRILTFLCTLPNFHKVYPERGAVQVLRRNRLLQCKRAAARFLLATV